MAKTNITAIIKLAPEQTPDEMAAATKAAYQSHMRERLAACAAKIAGIQDDIAAAYAERGALLLEAADIERLPVKVIAEELGLSIPAVEKALRSARGR